MNSREDNLKSLRKVLARVLPKKSHDKIDEIAEELLREIGLNTPTPSNKKGIVVMTEEGSMGKAPPKKL